MSELIYGARRFGKTTRAIEIVNKRGGYLVVTDRKQAIDANAKTERFPITFDELLKTKMRGSFVRNIVIDNFDVLLERELEKAFSFLSKLKVEAVTFTESPEEVVKRMMGKFIHGTKP